MSKHPVRRFWLFCIASVSLAAAMWPMGYRPANSGDELAPGSPGLIQASELAQKMKAAQKPVIFYVGPKAFYTQSHIAGAEYIGPAGKPEGLEKLRARAAALPKDAEVVIYCGCCPWDRCPNIRPAYAELKKAGFTKARVLYLPTSFGLDWKDKGLPVATGE